MGDSFKKLGGSDGTDDPQLPSGREGVSLALEQGQGRGQ